MDIVMIIVIELLSIIIITIFFSNIKILILLGIAISVAGIIYKKKNILFYIVPFIFLTRIYTDVNNNFYNKGEKIIAISEIHEGRGEVLKINNKFSKIKNYIFVSKLSDGKYYIEGNIQDRYQTNNLNQYTLDIIKLKKIEKNFIKNSLKKRVNKVVKNSNNEEKNLYKGIVLGEKKLIYKRIRILFIDTGVAHLLAISGLHMGIILYVISSLLLKIKIEKRIRDILTLIFLTVYFLCIPSSPSIVRSYIMAIIYLLGKIFYENTDFLKSLSISFIISLLLNPVIFYDVSFVLSYSAVLGIIIAVPLLKKINSIIKKYIKKNYISYIINYFLFTLILQIILSPLIYYYFDKFSIKTILYSLLITPVGTAYIFSCFVSLLLPTMFITNTLYYILINFMEFLLG
ncbi:MAG: ComEC/Rec2 family competence protein [Fusobacteriaceae bacterium]